MSVIYKNTSTENTSKLLCGAHRVHIPEAISNLYKMRAALETNKLVQCVVQLVEQE